MFTPQELAPQLVGGVSARQTGALTPFETALLKKNSDESLKPGIAKTIAILTVLLFSLIYAPLAQTAEVSISSSSLLSILNQDRIKYGLAPLTADTQLQTAAASKAQDILEQGYFAHTSPAGLKPWDFIKKAGFGYSFAGENLAINYSSAFELQNDFMNSPPHRENLLSPLFSEIGIAVVEGTYQGKPAVITVEMFASPKEGSAAN